MEVLRVPAGKGIRIPVVTKNFGSHVANIRMDIPSAAKRCSLESLAKFRAIIDLEIIRYADRGSFEAGWEWPRLGKQKGH